MRGRDGMHGRGGILIVDDEPNALKVLAAILEGEGYSVHESQDCDGAMEALSLLEIDTVITDLKMPGKDGTELFDHIQRWHSNVPVIFLTAYGTVDSAVQAITRGAFYYFIKPPDFLRLKEVVGRAVEKKLSGNGQSWSEKRYAITGRSEGMLKVVRIIESVRDSSSSVLISGETGTGRELAARALHYGGHRKGMPFVDVYCAAIPLELLEAELFGYEKGAFAGAYSRRIGRFEEAGSGTVFLDDIGELGMPLQAKLLREIEKREIGRMGGNKKIKTGFRLIASTNRDLAAEVKKGNFREDLFYRINVVQIKMPSLKERMDDLPLLTMEFLHEFSRRENKKLYISNEAMDVLQRYSWPGNVGQLRNIIERAVTLVRQERITADELPAELLASARRRNGLTGRLKTLKEIEMQAIRKALSQFGGNKSRAARALGISRKSFYKKMIGR